MSEETFEFEIENRLYKAGLNPFYGKFNRVFCFAPACYENKNKREFIENVQNSLQDIRFAFWGEVKVKVSLYFNEQTRNETPDLGDLDNYAKVICDALKGERGILIDDSQMQCLTISWIDTTLDPYFEIEVSGMPDEFCLKPIKLYEMPNKLFYPISELMWSKEGAIEVPEEVLPIMLNTLCKMTSASKQLRHKMRQNGLEKNSAYFCSNGITAILKGFHKNRVIDSGFELIKMAEWQSTYITE